MILKLGSDGPEVEALQVSLNALGSKLKIDGRFGPLTEMAVVEFQKAKNLDPDGKVGEKTSVALGIIPAPKTEARDSNEKNLRKGAKGTTITGIDVSHHDGHIKWEEFMGRVNFAFMKATESQSYIDPTFSLNWIEAKTNKILRGAYHFFRPDADATLQAKHFIKIVGVDKDDSMLLPPVLDLEVHGTMGIKHEVSGALTWLKLIEDAFERKPIIYLSPGFMNELGNPQEFYEFPLWIANYGVHEPAVPPPWNDWAIWQYSETGRVVGIKGNVDMNYFNGSLEDIQAMV